MDQPTTQDPLLAAFLAGKDLACPQCSYNLRDLRGDRCPECGEELVLRVNMAHPRQKLLIAGLIGLSAGAGFSGLMMLIGLMLMALHGGIYGGVGLFLRLGIGLVIESVAILFWLRGWRRMRNLSTAGRAWLMVGCWLLSLANAVALALFGSG